MLNSNKMHPAGKAPQRVQAGALCTWNLIILLPRVGRSPARVIATQSTEEEHLQWAAATGPHFNAKGLAEKEIMGYQPHQQTRYIFIEDAAVCATATDAKRVALAILDGLSINTLNK